MAQIVYISSPVSMESLNIRFKKKPWREISKKTRTKTLLSFTTFRHFRVPFSICIIYNTYLQKSSQNVPVIMLKSAMKKKNRKKKTNMHVTYFRSRYFNWLQIYSYLGSALLE